MFLLLTLNLFAHSFVNVKGSEYWSNFTDFAKCKVHYSRSERDYKQFYELPEESKSNDYVLDFHFSVLARSDAHILLSSKVRPEKSDKVYEVVLGAGGNTFSDIRSKQKSDVQQSIRIKEILSAVDVKSFWIRIRNDGLIEVGKEGEELGFLVWQDTSPLSIKFFSFCTWTGVEAKWFYDCPLKKIDSKEIDLELSDMDRLRNYIVSNENPYSILNSNSPIFVNVNFFSFTARINEHRSTLWLSSDLSLEWHDENLVWDPSNYSDITEISLKSNQIGTPPLSLENSISNDDADTIPSLVILKSTGDLFFNTTFQSHTWCNLSGLSHWPSDTHICQLNFSNDVIFLSYNFHIENLKHREPIMGWEIINVTQQGNEMEFTIHRTSNIYTLIFFTPFVVIGFCQLFLFMVSPEGNLKILLGCFQMILITLLMIVLVTIMPGHSQTIPYIVQLYSFSYIGATISIGLSILQINFFRNDHIFSLPRFVQWILTSPIVQIIFVLPAVKTDRHYGKLYSVSKLNNNDMWKLFGDFINRFALYVYTILFAYVFFCKY